MRGGDILILICISCNGILRLQDPSHVRGGDILILICIPCNGVLRLQDPSHVRGGDILILICIPCNGVLRLQDPSHVRGGDILEFGVDYYSPPSEGTVTYVSILLSGITKQGCTV